MRKLSYRQGSIASRRGFLKGAALASAGVIAFPYVLRGGLAPDKLRIVSIGCGGRGGGNLNEMVKLQQNIVALCDVNEYSLNSGAQKAPEAKRYKDFRKLYDELKDSEFDAVIVSTTEHTHAFATIQALKRKKHVYCEKPLTRDVKECRIIMNAAKEAGVVTQMGTQIHATENYRRVVELIQSGAIGPVHEAHVWVSRAWGWQSKEDAAKNKDAVWTIERPKEEMPVPHNLDWDLWIGPAPMRPYNDVYFPGPKWYRWWDFGNGTMSDLGSHWNDLAFWALKLDAPKTIDAAGPVPHPEIAPASMSATYEYGQRGDLPPVKLTWHQGMNKPKQWEEKLIPQWANGHLFIGSKGMVLSDYNKHVLLPENEFKGFVPPPKSIAPSPGQHAEWVNACKGGSPTLCHFGYSGMLTEANHLGNVAYRAGRKIAWDTRNLKTDSAEADKYIGREYRAGWTLG